MLTLNQLDYTRLCVESIFQHTTVPYELIIVDNGSSDGTRSYLRQRRPRPAPRSGSSSTTRTWASPMAATRASSARWRGRGALINNDTVVDGGLPKA